MVDPFHIAGETVRPGELRRIDVPVARLPIHTMLHLPLTVVHGKTAGARVWLSAAIHGDELNGMEIIRRVLERIRPERLHGTLIAAPIVNVFGFINQTRYLPDRRDLNRSFPGSTRGSMAAQLAHLFMTEIVARCTHGVDLHTAAPPRANLPQIRGNLDDPETRRMAEAFGAPMTIHAATLKGTLRSAATRRGIPIVLYEAGEPLRFNEDAIALGTEGVLRVLAALEMIRRKSALPRVPSMAARRTSWIRANQSGVVYLDVGLGGRVERKQRIGTITDPFGGKAVELRAPFSGVVIGKTNHPLVHRGDAVVHLAYLD